MYSFDEATKEKSMTCYLPLKFQLQSPDFQNVTFEAGPVDTNENTNDKGQSVTQKPKIYGFDASKYYLNIIDTPGLGDTRGSDQDQINLQLIHEKLGEIDYLNAICFVIPSNISKLTQSFEMLLRDLLSLFPKAALKNVFFIFTYSNSSFFTIGDTRKPIEEFIRNYKESNSAEIPFGPQNVCCVDSEAFMYFIANKESYEYHNRDRESFRLSWDKSKEAIEKFLQQLEELEPSKTAEICMNFELQKIAGVLLRNQENDENMKALVPHLLTKIRKVSLTSKFNSNRTENTDGPDQKLSEIFEGLFLCGKSVKNADLQQSIDNFIEKYGHLFKEQLIQKSAKVLEPTTVADFTDAHQGKHMDDEKTFYQKLQKITKNLAVLWNEEKMPAKLLTDYAEISAAQNTNYDSLRRDALKAALNKFNEHPYINNEIKNDIHELLNFI